MKVKSIRLKNGFKRFYDLTIDLGETPKRVVALVGPNGCGKSSVLDGFAFLQSNYVQFGKTGMVGYEYFSMKKDSPIQTHDVEIEFTDGNFASVYQQKSSLGKGGTIISLRSPYRYNANVRIKNLQPVRDINHNLDGASNASQIDDKMAINYQRLLVKYNDYLNKNDVKPSEAKKHIIGELNTAIKNCLDLEICDLGDIQADRGCFYFSKKDHEQSFDFNVLSSGEKEVIDIIVDLYVRKDDYNDTVFLLDEPELHINTAIQAKLLIEIEKMIGPNCQIWITTHSIGFLRALKDHFRDNCDVIQFDPLHNYAASPATLRPKRMTANDWKDLFSVALEDLTHLVSPKTIVYCEGRDAPGKEGSERGLDANVYNTIFGEKYPDVLFVSSGGNTELDQRSDIAISILTKVFKELEILVLKDRDMISGAESSEQDRKLYLSTNNDNHRVLFRREIENYLYDEEILRSFCERHKTQFDQEKYTATIQDIVNQDVKSITNEIKKICGVVNSINADKFKLQLSACADVSMDAIIELEGNIFQRQ